MAASPRAGVSSPLDSFSAEDRLLIQKTEKAITEGSQLEQWCRRRDRDLPFFPLALKKAYKLPNRAEGFFDSVEINGESRGVMGCRQIIQFGSLTGAHPAERLKEFVMREFLPQAHWKYDDGWDGGFSIQQSLYKVSGGSYGAFPIDRRQGCIDFGELGTRYEWVLLTVRIHDFVMDIGPWHLHLKEAACVAPNPAFVHVVENPSDAYVLEVSIGYPFVEVEPIPNFFGFGPGKFGVAVKLFSFFLTRKNEVVAQMYFAAAPRCQKVLDFGKRWPDPLYGGAGLLSRFTFGRWQCAPFHDRLDTQMLVTHCRVHQALMEGVHKVWTDWSAGGVS
jgi:hypothetical protein